MSPNGRLSQPTTVHSDRLSHTPFIEVILRFRPLVDTPAGFSPSAPIFRLLRRAPPSQVSRSPLCLPCDPLESLPSISPAERRLSSMSDPLRTGAIFRVPDASILRQSPAPRMLLAVAKPAAPESPAPTAEAAPATGYLALS